MIYEFRVGLQNSPNRLNCERRIWKSSFTYLRDSRNVRQTCRVHIVDAAELNPAGWGCQIGIWIPWSVQRRSATPSQTVRRPLEHGIRRSEGSPHRCLNERESGPAFPDHLRPLEQY